MAVKFSFEDGGRTSLGHIYRPIAKVTFHSPKVATSVDVWMVVDTGADYTILPRHISEKLRISFEKDCIKDQTFGVGGNQTIYFYRSKISVTIGHVKRKVPVAFFDTDEVPPLLGRLGFLETFDAEFLKNHVLILKDE